jgi:hypothetical protein
MTFIENKYCKTYYIIIERAKSRVLEEYGERHHIIPKSLGGSNKKDNLVKLTAREHFICHLLLVRMTVGHSQILMKFAVGKFIQVAPNQHRTFTSWEYKKIRESISQARTGKKHSDESKQKMSETRKGRTPWNKGITGIVHSEESNKKRSATMSGKKKPDDFGKKISNSKKGHKSGMTGKKHSEETIQRMKLSALNRKQKTYL